MTRGLPYQHAGARNVMIMAWCFEEKPAYVRNVAGLLAFTGVAEGAGDDIPLHKKKFTAGEELLHKKKFTAGRLSEPVR